MSNLILDLPCEITDKIFKDFLGFWDIVGQKQMNFSSGEN